MTVTGYWLDQAACANTDTAQFHAKTAGGQQKAIRAYCARCPVRAECLADALDSPEHQDHGVRGGKTRQQRRELRKLPDLPTGRDPVTIAALRQLLDAEQPDVPRHPAPRPKPRAPKETTVHKPHAAAVAAAAHAAQPPAPASAAEQAPAEPATAVRSISDLLDWAGQHPQAAIRKHAAKAREALAAIQQRHAADTELDQVQQEVERARKRLAVLEARAKELARPGAKATPARDYDTAEVRAWARRAGVACPAFGKIPAAVLEAWRGRDGA